MTKSRFLWAKLQNVLQETYLRSLLAKLSFREEPLFQNKFQGNLILNKTPSGVTKFKNK